MKENKIQNHMFNMFSLLQYLKTDTNSAKERNNAFSCMFINCVVYFTRAFVLKVNFISGYVSEYNAGLTLERVKLTMSVVFGPTYTKVLKIQTFLQLRYYSLAL